MHSLLLYPELKRLGKSIVIGSYSFGDENEITSDVETIFDQGGAVAKRVTGASDPDPYYGPEVHVCSYLDSIYTGSARTPSMGTMPGRSRSRYSDSFTSN